MKDAAMNSWATVTLSEVCNFENGDRGKNYPGRKALVPTGIPFINAGHITDGVINWEGMDFIPEDRFDLLGSGKIQQGDILYCLRGSLGKFGVIDREAQGAIASSLVIVRPNETLDVNFLAYYFRSPSADEMVDRFAGGTAQPNLSAKNLGQYILPLPPLEEQQRIVAVLDEAFEGLARARAHAEANLQNARELFNAELEKVFGVELADEDRATFEDITKDTLIGLVRSKKEQGPEHEYDYAKMNNIGNDDRFVGPVLDRVDCTPEEASRFELRGGDFLFNTRNSRELVGKSCVVESDFQRPTVFNNNLMRVRFGSGVSSRFVALAFKSKLAKAQLEAMKSGTTNVVAIYHKSLKKLTLPIPSLETQKALVDRFEELDAAIQCLISNYSEQAEDTDDLRQSLLGKAFAGELT